MTETAPYQPHSETSKGAAAAVAKKMAASHKKISTYLRRLAETGGPTAGATDEEMALDLDMPPNTQRPRRVELERMGMCKDSGLRRPTKTGSDAVIWVACQEPAQPDGAPMRTSKLRKALEPYIPRLRVELDSILEAGAPSGSVFIINTRTTEAQLRALIEAWEG